MKQKRSLGPITLVKNLVQAYFKRVSDLSLLAGLEARLAGKTLITIAFLGLVLAFVLFSTWFSLLLLLFVSLLYWGLSLIAASSIIAALNIIALIILYFVIVRIKKNLYFPATRRHFASMRMRLLGRD